MPARCETCNCFLPASGSCRTCARRAARYPDGTHPCKDCGKPVPSDTARCDGCAQNRVPYDRARAGYIARAAFPEPIRRQVLENLAAGMPLHQAAEEAGVSIRRIHAFRQRVPEWGEQLDAALTAGRDPNLDHGTENAYRHGKCRCPECRTAHRQPGAWWRSQAKR